MTRFPITPITKSSTPQPSFVFFAGKGGVGKSTCAAASAIAEAVRGRRVLLASSDPAHSIGDVLAQHVGPVPKRIGVGRGRTLRAVEIDAPRAFARWLDRRRTALAEAVEHGTWLDRHDVDALLDLSLPGVDELIALVEIVRLARASPTDVVVVDMAPTGHALRLIDAPQSVAALAGVLDRLQARHRYVRERFGRGASRGEAADRVVAEMAADAERIGAVIRDPSRTRFEWVALPEPLALEETKEALATLRGWRIPIRRIVVNRVLGRGARCRVCDSRRRSERRVMAALRSAAGALRIALVSEARVEPRGVALLAGIGRALARSAPPGASQKQPKATTTASLRRATLRRRSTAVAVLDAFSDARLVFFGGKGGVGKTSVAAAAALALARAHPGRRVLLISTDPAHSLGHVLNQPAGDRPVGVAGGPSNLRVRELDAPAALASRRGSLERALTDLSSAFGAEPDEASASRLLDVAPPGLDELFGLLTLVEATADPSTLVVVDTAPTGHTLRLLAMPDVAAAWIQTLLRMMLKYRAVAAPGQLAAELVELSRSIRMLSALLHDPSATLFVPVARAAETARFETERLLGSLRADRIPVAMVVVNALTLEPRRCTRCRRVAAVERAVVTALRRSCSRVNGCAIIQTPIVEPPPRGAAALERWAAEWIM